MKFAILFLILIAAIAYIIKKAIDPSDDLLTVEDAVAEAFVLIHDQGIFDRHVKRNFKGEKIHGGGTIRGLPRVREGTTVITLHDHLSLDDGSDRGDVSVGVELLFLEVDAPDQVEIGDYVEFTGILVNMSLVHAEIVLVVETSELHYVGERPDGDIDSSLEY